MLPLSVVLLLLLGTSGVLSAVTTSSPSNASEAQDASAGFSSTGPSSHHNTSSTSLDSSTPASSASTGIAGYIAHGLGGDYTSPGSISTSSSEIPSTRLSTVSTPSDSPTTTSTIVVTISTSVAATRQPSRHESAQVDSSSAINTTSVHNLTYTGACWDQWTEYWSYSAVNIGDFLTQIVSTETTPYPELETTLEFGTYTLSETYTDDQTFFEGAFPTSTSTSTHTEINTITGEPGFTFTLTNTIGTKTGETVITTTGFAKQGPITTPSCALPTIVAQCQSLWNAWVNESLPGVLPYTCSNTQSGPCSSEKSSFNAQFSSYVAAAPVLSYAELLGPTPLCSQASVSADGCRSLVKYLLTDSDSGARQTFDVFPSNSVLAPGCTAGCQTCAITGNSVQLYYWPPTTATSQNATAQAVITPAPEPVTQVSVHNGTSFTFTSPTIYISYEMLYASDSCSGIGPTFRNTIIPLTGETQLSSLMEYLGDADYPETVYKTMPFNLTDLVQTPVPASIYNKDPKCATSSGYTAYWNQVLSPDGAIASASFSCRQTFPYAPIIAVPEEVSNLDPAWKHCTAWYGGLYDPPQALTAASVEAKPTLPAESPTAVVAPSKSPVESPAQVTASPQQPVTPPSMASEVLGPTNPQQEPDPSESNAPPLLSEQSATSNDRQPALPSPEPSNSQPFTQEPASRLGQSDSASGFKGEPESPSIATPHLDGSNMDDSSQAQATAITPQSAPPNQDSAANPSEQALNNSPKVTSSGQEPSVGPEEASMDGMTETPASATLPGPRPPGHPASVVVSGSASYTLMQESGHVLVAEGGSTATAASGSAINLNDQSIVLGSSGEVVVGSITASSVETASPGASNDVVTVTGDDGHSITPKQQGSSYMPAAGSSTYALAAGSQTMIDGQTISVPNSGIALDVDGQTIASTAEPASQDNVVFDGHTLSPSSVTNYPGVQVIDGKTLTSGGAARNIDGITASIGSNGLVLDADGSTTTIMPSSAAVSRPDKTSSLPTDASPTSTPESSAYTSMSSNEGGHAGGQVPWAMSVLITLGMYVVA